MSFIIENFEFLLEQQNEIKQLKKVILNLAFKGSLTTSNEGENASELLKEVEESRKKLINSKAIKATNKLHLKAKENPPYSLPEKWKWVRFWDVIYCYRGHNPPKSEFIYKPKEGYVRFIQITDFKTENSAVYVPETKKLKRVNKGEIVIAAYRHIGKLSRKMEGAFNVALCKIINIEPFNRDYLELLIGTDLVKGELLKASERGHIPSMHSGHLLSLWVPIPPLAEQKRIVKKVNSLFQKIDSLAAQAQAAQSIRKKLRTALLQRLDTAATATEVQTTWQQVAGQFETVFDSVEGIQALRKSILQLAVKGKLVPQNASEEPAAVLLERIREEKERLIREKVIKKGKALPPIESGEVLFDVPEGWVWCRLQEVIDVRDGTHDSPKPYSGSDSYPLVTSKDFKKGIIDMEGARRISKEDYEKVIKRSYVEEHDILFSTIGGNIGNQVMVIGETNFAIKNVALFKYYNLEYISPYYLKIFTEHIAYTLQNSAIGGAQPFVSLTYLRTILFPLPPLSEQKRIIEKVNQLMTWCDRLEALLEERAGVKQRLLDRVMG